MNYKDNENNIKKLFDCWDRAPSTRKLSKIILTKGSSSATIITILSVISDNIHQEKEQYKYRIQDSLTDGRYMPQENNIFQSLTIFSSQNRSINNSIAPSFSMDVS